MIESNSTQLQDATSWNKMTMHEKLKFVKNKLGITDQQLGERLGVSTVAISQWRNGVKKPRQKHLDKLFNLSGMTEWLSDRYSRDAFLSQFTIAFDSVQHLFKDLTESGSDLARSNIVHSVSTKIAYLLEQLCKSDEILTVIHFHSVFGTPDAGEIMNITVPSNPSKCVDVCIKLGILNNEIKAMYIVEYINDSQVVNRAIGVITDLAITKITNNIHKFIK